MTLLDDYLPKYDFSEYHQARAEAAPEDCYRAVWEMDMRRSPLTGLLFRLRELPYRLAHRDFESQGLGFTLADMMELGFVLLGEDRPNEFVMGLAGRFWTLEPDMLGMTPSGFKDFDRTGYAKAAMNFSFTPVEGGTLIATETRIQCLGLKAKSSFRRYWTLIQPFSGLIRLEWLRLAARDAACRRSHMVTR